MYSIFSLKYFSKKVVDYFVGLGKCCTFAPANEGDGVPEALESPF